jgi:hypothetical protein
MPDHLACVQPCESNTLTQESMVYPTTGAYDTYKWKLGVIDLGVPGKDVKKNFTLHFYQPKVADLDQLKCAVFVTGSAPNYQVVAKGAPLCGTAMCFRMISKNGSITMTSACSKAQLVSFMCANQGLHSSDHLAYGPGACLPSEVFSWGVRAVIKCYAFSGSTLCELFAVAKSDLVQMSCVVIDMVCSDGMTFMCPDI